MNTVPSGAAISLDLIERIVGRKLTQAQRENARSVVDALNGWGGKVGLDQPHRQAQFLAQVLHESGAFRYDREVWGPTPAQERYDTRTDLGNTKAADGDGFLFRGRTGIQITGRANTAAFRDWCRKIVGGNVPDFERNPDAMLTDPWEGLGPIWYWDTRGLNRYADQGDVEMITKRINGGLNGYQDRLDWLAATSLVMLGYGREEVAQFQTDHGEEADGIAGPRTRAAMHKALVVLTAQPQRSPEVKPAPVVVEETVEKPVVPKKVEQKVKEKSGLWSWLTGLLGSGALGLGWVAGMDWQAILAGGVVLIVMLLILIALRSQIIAAVKDVRAAVETG